jgi:hypothetical protein
MSATCAATRRCKTFKDVLTTELIIGASNPGATTYDLPLLLNSVLGTKFRIVTGYPGSREITLALERGEVRAPAASAGPASKDASGLVRQGHHPGSGAASTKGHHDLNKRGCRAPRARATR